MYRLIGADTVAMPVYDGIAGGLIDIHRCRTRLRNSGRASDNGTILRQGTSRGGCQSGQKRDCADYRTGLNKFMVLFHAFSPE
jgi:hypothetical protein